MRSLNGKNGEKIVDFKSFKDEIVIDVMRCF